MKNLKISFKGNTSLVYVSMFKENIIDKINSVDPDTFNISDLNEFSHCEITAGLGLGAYKDEECFVEAVLDEKVIYSGPLLDEADYYDEYDNYDFTQPVKISYEPEVQKMRDMWNKSEDCKYVICEKVECYSSEYSVSFDVEESFKWKEVKIVGYCLDYGDVDLPFTIMEDCNLDYIEPISIVYKDRAFPLEHESDQGGGNEYHFYEKHDGNWSESLLLPDLLDKLLG